MNNYTKLYKYIVDMTTNVIYFSEKDNDTFSMKPNIFFMA